MHATYDPEADASYVRLREAGVGTARQAHTEVQSDGTIVDMDDEGNVIGYELLQVTTLGLSHFTRLPSDCASLVVEAIKESQRTSAFARVERS